MDVGLDKSMLAALDEFVGARIGLHFPPGRWRDLERGLRAACRELDFADAAECTRWLLSGTPSKSDLETLASHLTVGETYFLRDARSLEILEQHVLPELVAARRASGRRLRFWSAGCCTGEEPYSLAMLLRRVVPDLADWDVSILATDVNPRFLARAEAGVYGEWSFRGTPEWFRDRFFTPAPHGRFALRPEIRSMVRFASLNLAEDVYPSPASGTESFDLILCRNVLIYFAPRQAESVVRRFHAALRDSGWLLLGPSETAHAIRPWFVPVRFDGAILHRRDDASEPTAALWFESGAARVAGPAVEPRTWEWNQADARDGTPLPCLELADEMQTPLSPSEPEAATAPPGPTPEVAPDSISTAETLYAHGLHGEVVALLAGYERRTTGRLADASERRALALLARAEANLGHLDRALERCQEALAADKLDPGLHYLLATIRQERGEFELAATSLRRALYLDPEFALAHFTLGNVLARLERVAESRRAFANALALVSRYGPEDTLPESEHVTAGRLAAILGDLVQKEGAP